MNDRTTPAVGARAPGIYRDKAYKTRTVVLPDGRTFDVERGRIEARDPELLAWLDKHSEFERLPADTPEA